MALQAIGGSFPRVDGVGTYVILDATDLTLAGVVHDVGRTVGDVRTSQPLAQPTLTQRWTLLGWSIRLQIGYRNGPPAPPSMQNYWGTLGDLWAGVAINGSLKDAGGVISTGPTVRRKGEASLPQDLSTFAKVWTKDDPILRADGSADPSQPVGLTYMLPAPLPIRPGDTMQMALIWTSSVLGGFVVLKVPSCDYTILYDDDASLP
jgi:hypothetical protein